jgi:hypothetical protein
MPRIFTIYNCGTNSNRERTDEVIANLASRTEGGGLDYMITDGPGCKPPAQPLSGAETPGLRDPITGRKKLAGHLPVLLTRIRGQITGHGWHDNVARSHWRVHEVIERLGLNAITLDAINMAAWSRGAVTAHMQAHALYDDPQTRNIPLNIFAFDPVPGPGNFNDRTTSLPPNVRNYVVVLMEDDARGVFAPVKDICTTPGTMVQTIPLPGAHNTCVLPESSDVGRLAAALAERFLHHFGTRFRELKYTQTPVGLCELYARITMWRPMYRQMRGPASHRLLGKISRDIPNTLGDRSYFVNWHHEQVFQREFNDVYQAFDPGYRDMLIQTDRWEDVVNNLRRRAPTTHRSLVDWGVIHTERGI